MKIQPHTTHFDKRLVVSKNSAPSISALPSLSTVGLPPDVDFAPRYRSSKLSNAASAAVCAVSLAVFAVSLAVLAVSDAACAVCAAVAELAAAVALEAAFVALVVALEASTNKSYFAEFALLVRGCDPLEV